MKTKEELNALKEEVETLNKKLAELNEEELAQVSGGAGGGNNNCVWILANGFDSGYDTVWEKSGDEVENPLEAGTYVAGLAGREISPKN